MNAGIQSILTTIDRDMLRFWGNVGIIGVTNDDCWEWLGYTNNYGYGTISILGHKQLAHRISYTIFKGKIPEGLVIDHLCRNRKCINPYHMEAVTNSENVKR